MKIVDRIVQVGNYLLFLLLGKPIKVVFFGLFHFK